MVPGPSGWEAVGENGFMLSWNMGAGGGGLVLASPKREVAIVLELNNEAASAF